MSVGSHEQVRVPETDERLLERFRAGDLSAVGEFYRRTSRPVFLYAFSLIRDRAQAEDVVQQAFVRLLQQDPRGIASIRGLLYAIARNLVRDDLRRAAASRTAWPILEATADGPDPDLLQALSRALNGLPEEQREVVLLRIHADLPFADVAAALAIPEATAKSRYRYALKRMEELLER
jgi:RNA polymerase sigma-70 factor (ECF subfamily)